MAVEPTMQRRWEEQLAGYVRASFRAANLGNIAGQVASFVNKGTTVAILWIGAHLVMGGSLTIGQLIAFNMLAGSRQRSAAAGGAAVAGVPAGGDFGATAWAIS
jgi:ATP-binding cassette, subfamily B, bacterial HlyB/CyaB